MMDTFDFSHECRDLQSIVDYEIKTFTHIATIKQFGCLKSPDAKICVDFSSPTEDVWTIIIQPFNFSHEFKQYIGINLELKKSNMEKLRAKFEITIMDSYDQPVISKKNDDNRNSTFTSGGSGYGFDKFMARDDLFADKKILGPHDRLVVKCEISVIGGVKSKLVDLQSIAPVFSRATHLLPYFSALLNGGSQGDENIAFDIELVSQSGRHIRAHKVMLAARSAKFREIIASGCQKIYIDNYDFQVVENVVNFIYTDKIDENNCTPPVCYQLLEMALEYNVSLLIRVVEMYIAQHIGFDNAGFVFALACRLPSEKLQLKLVHFYIDNAKELHQSEEWCNHVFSNPKVATTLVKFLV